MSEYVLVTTTIDTDEAAQQLAGAIIQRQLAACAQVSGPIRSVYPWKGKIETATEWVCQLKTTAAAQPALIEYLREIHSYETPEIIVTPIINGLPEYLQWIDDSVKAPAEEA